MAAKKTSTPGKTTRARPTLPASHAKKSSAPARASRPTAAKTARAATKRVASLIAQAKERGRGEEELQEVKAKAARVKAPPAPPTSLASEKARELAILIAIAALEKKAVGLEIIDVAGRVDYADFLVVMTGRSDRQVNALAQSIEEALKKKGKRAMAVEGLPHAAWVIMDYADVVVHVFQDDARRLYDIEGLWMDAKRIPVPEDDGARDR